MRFERVKSVGKMNGILWMMWSHPYIEHEGANYFRELWRLIKRLLEATFMA